MLKLKQLARPTPIASACVFAFTIYRLVPLFHGFTEQQAGGSPLSALFVFLVEAAILFVLVYWITERLTRNPGERVKSVLDEKTRGRY